MLNNSTHGSTNNAQRTTKTTSSFERDAADADQLYPLAHQQRATIHENHLFLQKEMQQMLNSSTHSFLFNQSATDGSGETGLEYVPRLRNVCTETKANIIKARRIRCSFPRFSSSSTVLIMRFFRVLARPGDRGWGPLGDSLCTAFEPFCCLSLFVNVDLKSSGGERVYGLFDKRSTK